jgi:hypothetical protein
MMDEIVKKNESSINDLKRVNKNAMEERIKIYESKLLGMESEKIT